MSVKTKAWNQDKEKKQELGRDDYTWPLTWISARFRGHEIWLDESVPYGWYSTNGGLRQGNRSRRLDRWIADIGDDGTIKARLNLSRREWSELYDFCKNKGGEG